MCLSAQSSAEVLFQESLIQLLYVHTFLPDPLVSNTHVSFFHLYKHGIENVI